VLIDVKVDHNSAQPNRHLSASLGIGRSGGLKEQRIQGLPIPAGPDFRVVIPARFLKDPTVSPTAKLMLATLRAYADVSTGVCFVRTETVERLLRCGRDRREAAQRELVRLGWLRLGWRRGYRGKWARRVFFVSDPPCPDLAAAVKSRNLYQSPQSGQVTSIPTISDYGLNSRKTSKRTGVT
jgi:hypothetical protein